MEKSTEERSLTPSEIQVRLQHNQTQLDRDYDYFMVAISGLSNLRRQHALEYVATLQARIRMLQQLREAEAELL